MTEHLVTCIINRHIRTNYLTVYYMYIAIYMYSGLGGLVIDNEPIHPIDVMVCIHIYTYNYNYLLYIFSCYCQFSS